ncbi:MAG: LamG domain-containing protein, partial [Gammaproteobacteria bacterium]|nr:LamG domain-containing protein [Gammaproteobacteria bacterium]
MQRTGGAVEGTAALTISSWWKKGAPGSGSKTIFSCIINGASTAPYFYLETLNDMPGESAALHWAGYNGSGFDWNEYWGSDERFRDWGAWMHVHLKMSGTTTLIYLNGELFKTTNFASGYYPISGSRWQIGCNDSAQLAGASFADTYWIDGQALAPSAFGEVHEDTGQWVPKKYEGTYAGQSAFLNYSDSSDFGTDSSGLGNDFT